MLQWQQLGQFLTCRLFANGAFLISMPAELLWNIAGPLRRSHAQENPECEPPMITILSLRFGRGILLLANLDLFSKTLSHKLFAFLAAWESLIVFLNRGLLVHLASWISTHSLRCLVNDLGRSVSFFCQITFLILDLF